MATIEERIQAAVTALDIPGVVLVASEATGKFYYSNAIGASSLRPGGEPLHLDSVMWLASSTKIMTSIAALQCVERGQFTLDEDVTCLLPELKDIEILKGFEPGTQKPILTKATKKITLRHLLSHTSGLAYDIFTPILQRWRKSRGEETHFTSGSLIYRCSVPLLFEPGELWSYSPGLDWAGLMIERANHTTLEDYMQQHIWGPLSITNISFRPSQRPGMLSRLCEMSERQGGINRFGTPLEPSTRVTASAETVWDADMPEDCGGAGAYGSLVGFQKILHALAAGDERLLGAEMRDELFRPQLSDTAQAHFSQLRKFKELNDIYGVTRDDRVGHALGGVVMLEDMEGRRRKGTLSWQGMPNVYWWVDRAAGMSGVYGSQVIPTGDPKSLALFWDFERAMYEKAEKAREETESIDGGLE